MNVRLRVVAALATVALLVTGCGSADEPVATSTSTSQAPAGGASGVTCAYPADGQAAKDVQPPGSTPAGTEVAFTLDTSVGPLSGTLDGATTPCTVESFTSLAAQGYFDGTSCHRLTTAGIFVLQCGDPSATGRGGPGYTFADELTGGETYPAGTLAMANRGADTNGSQFFMVYADSQLPPSYTVFGQVDDASLVALQQVAEAGAIDGGMDGPPATPVTIATVTLG